MSETIDQAFEADNNGPAGDVTPLDSILDVGAADVPAQSRDGESSFDSDGGGDEPMPKVALSALKRERARRQRMDKRVKELEDELQKFNDQRWGFDADAELPALDGDDLGASDAYSGHDAGQDHTQPDPVAQNYSKSLSAFTSRHGQGEVDAVDAALKRLTDAQYQEVRHIARNDRDPAASIHAYVKQAGLLGFKPLSLQDVLDSKGRQQPSAELDDIRQQVAGLSQREQALHVAERRAIEAAARSEFVSDFGRQSFASLDETVGQLIQSNHPAVAQLREIYQSSPRPAYAVAQVLNEWGVWSPSEEPAQQQQRPAPVYPSNLANARSAAPRRGPAWSGPTSLTDIFDRKRA